MTAQQWVGLALQASIILTVVAFGLTATFRDATWLFRHPGLLLRTLLSMNVAMPIVAGLIGVLTNLPMTVKLALVALSVSPVPPIVQKKQVAAGGRTGYVLGLMVAMSIFAIALIPLTVEIFNRAFDGHNDVSPAAIAAIVAKTVLLPILAALLVRHFYPPAAKAAHAVRLVASAVLGIAVLLLLVKLWPLMVRYVGDGVVLMLAAMAVAGVVIGYLLGGPDAADREVLATSTASRHPAVAIAVANGFVLADRNDEVAIVLMYLIVASIVTAVYQKWQSRRIGGAIDG